MLRVFLLGILAVSTTAGCGTKHDAPEIDPAAPAGKVLEVSGRVTVGAKPLAVGDTIKANDLIDTGTDGSVVIQLAHNDARWELGPNHKSKPSDSLAWTAERSTKPAKQVEQDTSAAGRPAERSAADTSTSVGHGGAGAAEKDLRETRGARSAAPAPPTADVAPSAAPAPPSATPAPGAATASSAAPPPPPAAPEASMAQPKAAPSAKPATSESKKSKGGAPAKLAGDESPSAIQQIATLSACIAKGHKVSVKVHVANHVPAITFVGAVDAKVKTCITDAAKKLSLPIESGDMSLTLSN